MITTQVVQKAVEEIRKRPANYEYFFDRLQSSDWIESLLEEGFFRAPPEPIREGDLISFPAWPESRYLARVAAKAPELVLRVMLDLPPTDNNRVHEDLDDAAIGLPADVAARWADKEAQWVATQPHLYGPLPHKLGDLVKHLSKGSQSSSALRLARSLLRLVPVAQEEESRASLLREPVARFGDWDYAEVLKGLVPSLLTASGLKALEMLCDLLEVAVRSTSSPDAGPADYSYIWRPAIEDHAQNLDRGIRVALVSAVRDAAEQLASADPDAIPIVVERLEARGLHVFQRIALHLLRRFPDGEGSRRLIAERLTDRKRMDETGIHHEYWSLAREAFPGLSPADRAALLTGIAAGPDLEELKAGHEQRTGAPWPDQEAQAYVKHWRLLRLALLKEHLEGEWLDRYRELASEYQEPDHPEFLSYMSEFQTGPTSPRTAEELRSMSIEELVGFLAAWEPPPAWMGPSREGLGGDLAGIVASDPERFAGEAIRFIGQDPTYVRCLLTGFWEAAKQGRTFPWPAVLELCKWVMIQPREIPGRRTEYSDRDPGWVWTRRAIADLLEVGFGSGAMEIPFEFREGVWAILRPLADDPDPTPEHEEQYGGTNMDPPTLAINTTRGKAMHAVVHYALWVRRHVVELPDGAERAARGFEEMPEAREMLDARLDPTIDPSLAVRSVYGQFFPWLVLLDSAWARQSVEKVFPAEEGLADLRDAAWETYLAFCPPYDDTFEILHEEYRRATGDIGRARSDRRRPADVDARLSHHLMILYWRGRLELEGPDGLLQTFYEHAPAKLRGEALDFVGRSLYHQAGPIPGAVADRLTRLWSWRLETALAGVAPEEDAEELIAFGWWFASGKFDDLWSLEQLTQVLKLVGRIDPNHLVAERLAALAEAYPWLTVACLRLLVEGDRNGWSIIGWRDDARRVLDAALGSGNPQAREAATDLIHYLGARGYKEFRDLTPP